MKKEYIAILTVYNRLPYLNEQIAALLNQSIPPKQIYVWVNKDVRIKKNPNAKYIISDENFKFWGRFALAQIMQSEYIMILDDDTIPGKKWAENCFSSFSIKPGIYGGNGIYLKSNKYKPNIAKGWKSENEKIERVDLVGHAWFFPKKYLKYFWMEEPADYYTGEDIHFSYTCKKYGNINTYVPPHPASNKKLWSSVKGAEYGNDENASYKIDIKKHYNSRNLIVEKYVKSGWKISILEK
jgi:hypothetical protein